MSTPKPKRSRLYGDACATIRSDIRLAIAETAHITGLKSGDGCEALVEVMFSKIAGDGAAKWAIRELIDHEPSRHR